MNKSNSIKDEIETAKKRKKNAKKREKNAESFIYNYFEDIKRKVDLRREDLKMKIDDYSDEIIKSVESTKAECIKLSSQVSQLKIKVQNSKKVLDELICGFDKVDNYNNIKQSTVVLNDNLKEIIDNYKYSLIGYKEYSFEFKDLPIEYVFGSLCEIRFKFDSTILDTYLQYHLVNLCEFPKETKWELKYRASRDGFKGEYFHSKCDGIKNTLTIIKTTSGNVFGGFGEPAWVSKGVELKDPKSFIFSLINKENKPFKALCANGGIRTLSCGKSWGPSFGYDDSSRTSIYIGTDSNINDNSDSDFGYCYTHPDYPAGSKKAKTILAGSQKFQTVEIEVFTKIVDE